MKKLFITIVVLILGVVGFFVARPEPPFAGISNEVSAKYVADGKALERIVKDNPKDRIVARVGTKEKDSPEVTLSRWDEVSVNVKYKTTEATTRTTNGEKIVYSQKKNKVEFYELSPTASLSEGGYEVEVTLLEKPDTNVVSFDVQSQGLDWFYQPELTQDEKNKGAYRPDNVVGSYAVYYHDTPTNYVGGKEYKTGKAFHVYRPRIVDAAGNETWGSLHYENGVLTATIPQEFLDKAVYPVRHAAGLTFGYTNIGASDEATGTTMGGANPSGLLGTLTESGSISKITHRVYVSVSAKNITSKLYSGSAGSRGSLLATTTTSSVETSEAWVDFNFASSYSAAATTYWLDFQGYGGDGPGTAVGHIKYDTGGGANTGYITDDFGSPLYNTKQYSSYATYTTSTPASPSQSQDGDIILSE